MLLASTNVASKVNFAYTEYMDPEYISERVRSALPVRITRAGLFRLGAAGILTAAGAIEFFVNRTQDQQLSGGTTTPATEGNSIVVVEAAELPDQERPSSKQELKAEPYDFMLQEFNDEQKSQMKTYIEKQAKEYIGHGALGARLRNAKESAAILEEILTPEIREKLGVSDEIVKAFEALMFIETEDGGETTSIAGAVGPTQITPLAALDAAEFLEQQDIDPNKLDPQAKLKMDYVSQHNLDDLRKLTKKQQISLGFAYYLRLLRAYEREGQGKINYGFAGVAYNAGMGNVNKAKEGLDINNISELYSPENRGSLPEGLANDEAEMFYVRQAAGVWILAKN